MTQQKVIINYLREIRLADKREGSDREGFRYKHEIIGKNTYWGLITLVGERRIRELVEEGYLERTEQKGKAMYRYVPKEEQEPPKVNLSNEREFAQHVLL